jgi:hypothetical protein
MAIDLVDEGRSIGTIRGIFDQERDAPVLDTEDLLARAEIALAELVRSLRRDENRAQAMQGRQTWHAAFMDGYREGRLAAFRIPPVQGPVKASDMLPPRTGHVCAWCRAEVAAELSGFDLDADGVVRALGDESQLDNLARELGADIPGHRCEARDGLGTCACGCSIWREH